MNRRRGPRTDTAPPFRADDGRWQELLAISADIFARKGYKSTTLQDIADAFGVLKGSLYHYIRSKDDLLYEIIRGVLGPGIATLRTLAEAPDLDPVERLHAVVRGHVLYLIDNLVETTVLLHEFDQLSPERQAEMPIREYQDVLAGLVEEARSDPRLKPDVDPQLTALAILGATNWVYRWYRPGGTHSPQRIADYYAELLVGGLLQAGPPEATPTAPARARRKSTSSTT